jgi:hypothetical protein
LPFKFLLKVVHNLSRVTPDMNSFIGGGSFRTAFIAFKQNGGKTQPRIMVNGKTPTFKAVAFKNYNQTLN